MIDLRLGDCLEVMPSIPDGSIDLILADLPYGTTACKWDTIIPLEPLWAQYKRIIKRNGAIVLTASQPFTTTLIASNPMWFRYELIWDKVNRINGFLNAKVAPLKKHENVLLFYRTKPTYNPQMVGGEPYIAKRSRLGVTVYGQINEVDTFNSGTRYPTSILSVRADLKDNVHPTQKPVALMEYLIRTYTNEGETVLDNTMGSGTTGVACVNTGRSFIGIEKDSGYFQIAQERIRKAQEAHQMEMAV